VATINSTGIVDAGSTTILTPPPPPLQQQQQQESVNLVLAFEGGLCE
jgi:hypothetical protein